MNQKTTHVDELRAVLGDAGQAIVGLRVLMGLPLLAAAVGAASLGQRGAALRLRALGARIAKKPHYLAHRVVCKDCGRSDDARTVTTRFDLLLELPAGWSETGSQVRCDACSRTAARWQAPKGTP